MAKRESIKKEAAEEKFSLEESFELLEQTISKLETKETTLEESFNLYQKGMELLKNCNSCIDHVEKKVLALNGEGQCHEL